MDLSITVVPGNGTENSHHLLFFKDVKFSPSTSLNDVTTPEKMARYLFNNTKRKIKVLGSGQIHALLNHNDFHAASLVHYEGICEHVNSAVLKPLFYQCRNQFAGSRTALLLLPQDIGFSHSDIRKALSESAEINTKLM